MYMHGGNVSLEQESCALETVIRSVCAFYYAVCRYNETNKAAQEQNKTDAEYDTMSDIVIYDKDGKPVTALEEKLKTMLERLDQDAKKKYGGYYAEMSASPLNHTATADASSTKTQIYYHYLPFMQDQIHQLGVFNGGMYRTWKEGLQSMYDSLLQETNIETPKEIDNIISLTLQNKLAMFDIMIVAPDNVITQQWATLTPANKQRVISKLPDLVSRYIMGRLRANVNKKPQPTFTPRKNTVIHTIRNLPKLPSSRTGEVALTGMQSSSGTSGRIRGGKPKSKKTRRNRRLVWKTRRRARQ